MKLAGVVVDRPGGDVAACDGPHRWAGEILHTFTAAMTRVSVRTCSLCGAVRISRRSLKKRGLLRQRRTRKTWRFAHFGLF